MAELIELVTRIDAPIETCFRLSLNIDLELEAAKAHGLRAVSGVTSGFIGRGERVGWRTRQFGISVSHESEITELDEPFYFADRMVQGLFSSFEHRHFYSSITANRTEMRDEMRFAWPWWLGGAVAARWIVKPRLTTLLQERNRAIQAAAILGWSPRTEAGDQKGTVRRHK